MSWAFIKTMRENPRQSYINVLQNTRGALQQKYQQIPQLSVGGEYDLNQLVSVRRISPASVLKCTANLARSFECEFGRFAKVGQNLLGGGSRGNQNSRDDSYNSQYPLPFLRRRPINRFSNSAVHLFLRIHLHPAHTPNLLVLPPILSHTNTPFPILPLSTLPPRTLSSLSPSVPSFPHK